MVETVTFPPELYALKSICIQFLIKYTAFCVKYHFLLGNDFRIFAKVVDFEEIFFRVKNILSPIFFICQYIGIELQA